MTAPVAVLIIAGPGDRHADVVGTHLHTAGVDAVRFASGDIVAGQVSVEPGRLTINTVARAVVVGPSTTVWWFRAEPPPAHPAVRAEENQLIAEETLALLLGSLEAIGVRWVDNPFVVDRAELKILQLRTATALGIPVPATLVTNVPAAGLQFIANHLAVAKAMSNSTLTTGPVIAPTVQHVDAGLLSALGGAPTLLQQDMLAAADLRVVVIGDQTWSWRRPRSSGELDWRAMDPTGAAFVPVDSSKELNQWAVAMTSAMSLSMSTQDWVEDANGRLVFLEANPQGAWMFLAQAETRVVPALADHISDSASRSGVWPSAWKRFGYDFLTAERAPSNDGMRPPVFGRDLTRWVAGAAGHPQALDLALLARAAEESAAARAEEKAGRLLQLDLALLTITVTLGGYQVHQVVGRSLWWLFTLLPVLVALATLVLSASEASQVDRVGFYVDPDAQRLLGLSATEAKVETLRQITESSQAALWTARHKHSDLMQARAWFSRGLLALVVAGVTAAVITGVA